MFVPTPTPTPTPKREFDQIVSADVKIKKLYNSDDEYKITFVGNVSKVLLYQVWSPNSLALNNDRKVFELKLNDWANLVFSIFNSPVVSYTPTCVMEIDDGECPIHKHKNDECRHVFVINNAKVEEVNDCRKVVFYVSSKDIDKNNKNKVIKKLKKIPTTKKGELFHARFDIDSSDMIAKYLITDDVVNNSTNSIASYFNQQIINFYADPTNTNTYFTSTNNNIISWNTIPSFDDGFWAYLAYKPKYTPVYVPTTAILTDVILTNVPSSLQFGPTYYLQLLFFESYYVIKLNSKKVASNVYTGSYIQPSGVNETIYSNSIPQQFQADFTTYVGTQLTSPVTTTISSVVPPNFIGAIFPNAKFAWVRTYTNGSPPEVKFYSFVNWVNTSTASGQIPVASVFGTRNVYVYNTGVGVNSVYNSEYNCWNLSFYVYNPNGGYTQGPPVDYGFFKETNPNVDYTCMGYYPIPPGLFET
jgi:hypothetical protein